MRIHARERGECWQCHITRPGPKRQAQEFWTCCVCLGHAHVGRPVTTGSDGAKPVQFRVSAAERADLERRAAAAGESVGQYARRRTLAAD